MKPALTRILTLVAACGALVCGARAGVNTYSIGFNFATNEPNGASLGGLLPTDVAGVPAVAQPNWNNLSGANGEMTSGIVANQNGTAFPTSVGLTWASEGTWASTGRGEPNGDNYFAPDSPDRILNTGYLDTGNSTTTRITITNLPSDLTTPGYDVYVYALGGVQGRGGSYRILNAADLTELRPYQLGSSANAPTNYVMDTGETHNNETGTYLVFRNLTAPGIVVEATTTVNPTGGTPRAPINAVQLVAAAATGEAEPATGLNITPGDGQIEISWTPGAGSSGSLVVMRAGRRVTAQPVDGVTYTANATFGQGQNLGDDNIGSPNYVVYAGSGNSVTVSNVFGTTNYHVAVYSFTGNNYTLLNPPTGSATPLANLVSLELNVPSSIVRGAAHNVRVLANYSDGGTLDVTASATVTSSVPAVVSILPGPKAAGLSLGSATLTATYETFSTDKDVSVENMSMTHQYSMSGTSGSTDVQDSVGDAHGIVVTPDMFSGQDGGLLLLSGTDSNYVELPANLISDYGALTIETWASDSGNVNWARLFDFGVDANRYLFLSPWAANNGTVRFAITVNGAGSEQQLSSGNAGFGEHHYVLVIEGASRIGRLFVDGMQVALNTNMTLTPEDIGPMPNVWLGRSQYAADGYFNGSINEFRIYNGPLDSLQIALNAATGPNTTVTDPGACTGISLLVVNPNMVAGDTQQGTVTATFANVGNPVNITTAPQTTYSSSNTNVARVSASGLVTAVGPGDAIITASAFGQNSQVMVTVAEQPIVLSHRYSFTADGTDSIGGFHAALLGNAQIVDGQVFLDGVNANASYVELPGGILADYNSLTFEIWYTDDNAGNWSRVWDFGSSTANYLFFTVRANSQLNARTAITTGSGEQVVNFRRPNMGTEHHIVYTQDAVTGLASIYHNGVLVATNAVTIQPRQLGATTQNWLGRSQFADPYFRGFINEFRIWRGAISPTQVALSYGLGPDNFTTVTNPGAVSSVTVSVPDLAAGQTRQARAIVNFAQVSGVNMAPFASNWISSDISVAKVDQNGVVTGVGPGTATISATYGGVTGNGSVTVSAGTPVLANRYSFDGNANDSVGGAHGTLGAGASISDGAVVLTGANDSFVALPGGLLAGKSAVTIETWATFTNSVANASRLWDFGSSAETNWVAFAPRSGEAGNTQVRYALFYTNNSALGGTGELVMNARGNTVGTGSGEEFVHYVVVLNPLEKKVQLYENGVFFEEFDWGRSPRGNIVPLLLEKIQDAEAYIGRAVQTNGTPPANYIGKVTEFRIWNGALDKVQIAASYAAGPDTVSIDPGVPSSVTLELSDPTAVVGTIQRPTVLGTFAGGTIDLTGAPGVGFTSDNPNVVRVDGNRLRAVGVGTANIVARYAGVTDSKAVTVVEKSLRLTHRYPFNGDALDRVGEAHGVLKGNARIQNNQLVLTGQVNPLTYVEFPSDLISGYDAVTVEVIGSYVNANNNRLFEFGDYALSDGVTYFSHTPNQSRAFTLAPLPVRNGGLAAGGQAEASATAAQNVGRVHITVVANENTHTIHYYTNGVLAASVTNNNVNVSTIVNARSFLGRSVWLNDPLLNGTVDEYRIWYGAMTPSDVALMFAAGSDPELSATVSGGNVTVKWLATQVSEGYSLEYSPSLSPASWTAAGAATLVGDSYQVVIPLASLPDEGAFFRLVK